MYRIVEKAILVVFFSYLFFTTGSLLYLNEKAIVRRNIERVKDVSECNLVFLFIRKQRVDAEEQQGFG